MAESSLENPLLAPILDQIKEIVDYTHVSIYVLDGTDLTLLAYRGPVPATEASLFSFPLSKAGGARWVISHEVPLLIADAKGDTPIALSFREAAREVPERTFDYIGSWIGLPLHIGGRVMGMLDLAHQERNYYTKEHVSQIQDYVKHVAVNIENAVLYANLTQRSTEIQTLYAVQQAINSHLDMPIVLQLVADQARRLTSARQSLIFLLEDKTLRAAFGAGETTSRLWVGYKLPLRGSLVGEALRKGQPVRIFDAEADPRLRPAVYRELGVRSLLIVPLRTASRPIGALVVTDKVFGAFGPNDERVLATVAAGAAIGLENAQIYRDEQERRRSAEIMQQILAHLSSNQSLEDILSAVVACAGELLETESGAVFQVLPGGDQATVLTWRGLDDASLEALLNPLVWQIRLAGMPVVEEHLGSGLPLNASPRSVPLLVSDLAAWAQQAPTPPGVGAAIDHLASRFHTALLIPLVIKDKIDGCIELYYRQPRSFSRSELQQAETIGKYVALAVERGRLVEKAEELARLQERQRIAQALHDTVAQMLFRIGLEAEWFQENLPQDEDTLKRVQTVQRLVARSSYELRSAIFALRNRDLAGDHSLVQLLEEQVAEFQDETGIQATLIAPPDLAPLPSAIAEAIFRIAREALANVRKHAQATAVLVSLDGEDSAVTVTIQDNGVGLDYCSLVDPGEAGMHFGVNTMRKLVTQLNGRFLIDNNDDHGVMIKARFPIGAEVRA